MKALELKHLDKVSAKRSAIATSLAIIFHAFGAAGLVFMNTLVFNRATIFNLILMLLLLLWTQPGKEKSFYRFFFYCFFIGMTLEIIGRNTGLIFGGYTYGSVLGPQLIKVPVLIGINWFILTVCIGAFLDKFWPARSSAFPQHRKKIGTFIKIFAGAILFVLFDLVMEGPAVKLGYWQWTNDGLPPAFNSHCWFVSGFILLWIRNKMEFAKDNQFAVNLIGIQFLFFLFLQIFL